jgi:hypothetical protein
VDVCGAGGRYPSDECGSDHVVVIAPLLNNDLGFLQAVEDFVVEVLVTPFAIEGLAIAVLPRAGLNIEVQCQPGSQLRTTFAVISAP